MQEHHLQYERVFRVSKKWNWCKYWANQRDHEMDWMLFYYNFKCVNLNLNF